MDVVAGMNCCHLVSFHNTYAHNAYEDRDGVSNLNCEMGLLSGLFSLDEGVWLSIPSTRLFWIFVVGW